MEKISIQNLVLLTLLTPCLFHLGSLGESVFEPFIGAVVFSVVYMLLICGRAPKIVRTIACFVMSWFLYLWARTLNAGMEEFNAPLLNSEFEIDEFPVQAHVVFGYGIQSLISVVIAAIAFVYGGKKFVTMDE